MKIFIFAVMVLASLASPVFAAPVVFDFANLKYDGSGTTLSDFTGFKPSDGVFCTVGDLCSSNVNNNILGDDLTYGLGGFTVHATGYYNGNRVAVVQDHDNGFNGLLFGPAAIGAGLGVYHVSGNNSDDNVTAGEMLKLSFNQVVPVTTIGLRAEGHNTTGWITGATFEYSLDGSTWTTAFLPDNSGMFNLNLSSQNLYFKYGGGNPDQFYVSSITAIPEPEIYAMMLAGLGLMGFVARRRRQKDVAA